MSGPLRIFECSKCGEVWGVRGSDMPEHDCEAEEEDE